MPDSAQQFEWDVFLSHSSLDKPKVGRLHERLQAEGLKVWFDREAIADGKDIVQSIEHGLENSRVVILCMTEAALQSEWVRVERNTATFRDPANTHRRFLPLLFEDCHFLKTLRSHLLMIRCAITICRIRLFALNAIPAQPRIYP